MTHPFAASHYAALRLLQSGAEIDMRDSNDMTALHHACAGLHYGCVHFLLQGGADPRCTEKVTCHNMVLCQTLAVSFIQLSASLQAVFISLVHSHIHLGSEDSSVLRAPDS